MLRNVNSSSKSYRCTYPKLGSNKIGLMCNYAIARVNTPQIGLCTFWRMAGLFLSQRIIVTLSLGKIQARLID